LECEKVENLHFQPAKSRDIINQYNRLRILQGRRIKDAGVLSMRRESASRKMNQNGR
jgi:hypothetical protein